MPLPIENVIAAFPPSVKAGNVTLGPLSIGGAIRLAEVGVDAKKTPVPKDRLFVAAWILSGGGTPPPLSFTQRGWGGTPAPLSFTQRGWGGTPASLSFTQRGWGGTPASLSFTQRGGGVPPALRKFLRHAKCGLKELSDAVEEVLNQAFSTFIPPMQEKDAPVSFTPDGLGWPLELAGFLCAEYGWTFEYALATPVCRAFALQAVSRVQHGGRHGGPDYVERTLDIMKNANH